MTDAPIDFSAAVFSKTAAGQQEIQSRALGLSPLARRLLVLIDGKRTGKDLAPFVAGHPLAQYIDELLGHACIDVKVAAPAVPAATAQAFDPAHPQPPDALPPAGWLAALPPAETRSEKELEMARNFMINTVNNIFGHHNRISLVESIFGCKSSSELRNVYSAWATALESSSAGHKRLPELREKLFAVL
ncbi:MAG: hypothetical protein WAT33_08445 [Giesbergeria sp.]|jgi:hypothetical protein